jgi:hypothetical protein
MSTFHGEFKIRTDRLLNLCVRDNGLVVSNSGCFSYFSKDGIYFNNFFHKTKRIAAAIHAK